MVTDSSIRRKPKLLLRARRRRRGIHLGANLLQVYEISRHQRFRFELYFSYARSRQLVKMHPARWIEVRGESSDRRPVSQRQQPIALGTYCHTVWYISILSQLHICLQYNIRSVEFRTISINNPKLEIRIYHGYVYTTMQEILKQDACNLRIKVLCGPIPEINYLITVHR